MNLVFDLETNGLFFDLTKIHCLCIHDLDEATTHVFNDEGGDKGAYQSWDHVSPRCGSHYWSQCYRFDCPAISKLYGFFDRRHGAVSVDTYFSAGYFMLTFLP